MEGIRVVVVDMPHMLNDLVRDLIIRCPGMNVVAELADEVGLDRAIATGRANVVVAGSDAFDAGPLAHLIAHRSGVAVLTIAHDGRSSALYEARRLGEVSPQQLLATIRNAAEGILA